MEMANHYTGRWGMIFINNCIIISILASIPSIHLKILCHIRLYIYYYHRVRSEDVKVQTIFTGWHLQEITGHLWARVAKVCSIPVPLPWFLGDRGSKADWRLSKRNALHVHTLMSNKENVHFSRLLLERQCSPFVFFSWMLFIAI